MDRFSTPPPVPVRMRRNARRQSVPPPSLHLRPSDPNRVHVQPASPEVISNLITSLSIISAPANHLFEESLDSLPLSPRHRLPSFTQPPSQEVHHDAQESGGSFGIDYGAFHQPSALEDIKYEGSIDELAAPTPAIKTSRPPSGLSPLTAPKSPSKESSFRSLLGTASRPSSKGSNSNKDDASSIGTPSIEPGVAREIKAQGSSDSWGKKQGRHQKGLMYMSSKEALRESERKRSGAASGPASPAGLGLDRLPLPDFEATSFLAESPIREESGQDPGDSSRLGIQSSATSPAISPALSQMSRTSQNSGGVGSGMFIPPRDSSLQQKKASSRSRSSKRPSRQDGKQKEGDDLAVPDGEELRASSKSPSKKKSTAPQVETISKLQEPFASTPLLDASTLASKQVANAAKIHQRLADDEEEAPSPSVGQRHSRLAEEEKESRSSSKERKSGRTTPDIFKREGSKLRRLSQPLSPTSDSRRDSKRDSKAGRKSVVSPEPKTPQIQIDDRPNSADSVDDAVDSYLSSPRLSQKIRHPQNGRVISFSEVGDPAGHAVFCCVGMGLTKYITAFYDELALTLKLRLITPDRPGVGESEPYTDGTATPLSWPDDVYAICQALKITKFSILAHSAGAIYALATALRMPQHIRGRIHLLAPWIPPSQLNVFGGKALSPPSNSIPTSQRILRALPTPILKAANSSFMSATSSSITSSLPKSPRRGKRRSTTTTPGRDTPTLERNLLNATPSTDIDKENLGPGLTQKPTALSLAAANPLDPNHESAVLAAAAQNLATKERQTIYDTRLTHAIWDLATVNANPAVDLLVCLERRHTIGFRYVDITRAVVIHHGSKDNRVPVENVKWLGKMMRRCEVRILEGEGHGLMASAAVMGGVLMEISREWEDWMQVVSGKDGGVARRTLRERASVGAFR